MPSSGAVIALAGIEGGVVSGVINLELCDVEAPDWRPTKSVSVGGKISIT
jgi:hypothetical protein